MLYLETSFLAPLILEEATSEDVEAFFLDLSPGQLQISHWTRVEFASLVAREVRMGGLAEAVALLAIGQFDEMVASSCQVLVPGAADYELAKGYVENFATKLRAGDALHLAIASNHGATMLCTLDEGLLAAARLMQIPATKGIKS